MPLPFARERATAEKRPMSLIQQILKSFSQTDDSIIRGVTE